MASWKVSKNEDFTGTQRGVPFEYPFAAKLYAILFRKAGLLEAEILSGIHHLRGAMVTLLAHLPRDRGGGRRTRT